MNFKTQICTTKEQSERLLALGLKEETADMVYEYHSLYKDPYFLRTVYYEPYDFVNGDIPAWSLHRLITMYCSGLISCQYDLVGLSFDGLIGHIEAAIKTDKFNEEYLNKRP